MCGTYEMSCLAAVWMEHRGCNSCGGGRAVFVAQVDMPAPSVCCPNSGRPESLAASSVFLPNQEVGAARTMTDEQARIVCATAPLDDTFKSLRADGLTEFQFFGSTTGVARMFPGVLWGLGSETGLCQSYDARLRPWYDTLWWLHGPLAQPSCCRVLLPTGMCKRYPDQRMWC